MVVLNQYPMNGRGRGRVRGCTWNPSQCSVEVGEEILTDDEEISEGSEEEDKEEGSRRRAVMAVKRRSNCRPRIA